jgi:hypothetical protein
MILLDWVEQQRQSMHRGDTTTASSNVANNTVQKRSLRSRVHLRKNAQASPRTRVLGQAQGPGLTAKYSEVLPQHTTYQRKLKPRKTKQSSGMKNSKDSLLLHHQFSSQKVTKRQPRSRGSALASRPQIVTRSGRISKPPNRWVRR